MDSVPGVHFFDDDRGKITRRTLLQTLAVAAAGARLAVPVEPPRSRREGAGTVTRTPGTMPADERGRDSPDRTGIRANGLEDGGVGSHHVRGARL